MPISFVSEHIETLEEIDMVTLALTLTLTLTPTPTLTLTLTPTLTPTPTSTLPQVRGRAAPAVDGGRLAGGAATLGGALAAAAGDGVVRA